MMRTLKHISIFFCLTLVFSCTKPEGDAPQKIVPSSVTDEPFDVFDNTMHESLPEEEEEKPIPVYINDDGDDESGPSNTIKNPR